MAKGKSKGGDEGEKEGSKRGSKRGDERGAALSLQDLERRYRDDPTSYAPGMGVQRADEEGRPGAAYPVKLEAAHLAEPFQLVQALALSFGRGVYYVTLYDDDGNASCMGKVTVFEDLRDKPRAPSLSPAREPEREVSSIRDAFGVVRDALETVEDLRSRAAASSPPAAAAAGGLGAGDVRQLAQDLAKAQSGKRGFFDFLFDLVDKPSVEKVLSGASEALGGLGDLARGEGDSRRAAAERTREELKQLRQKPAPSSSKDGEKGE